MRVLLTGWFSFPGMGATAGDLLARDVVAGWLEPSGVPFDILNAPAFGGSGPAVADPSSYSHVVFVCGPIGDGPPLNSFLNEFRHAKLVALDVTLLQELSEWNPFDLLIERDGPTGARPDLSFAATVDEVPVAGLILAHKQSEYGNRARHEAVNEVIWRAARSRCWATLSIDTCLDPNAASLDSPAAVVSLISKMDLVLTTRLHGLVLALMRGVPVVAFDPIDGGAKVLAQAKALGWPAVLTVDDMADERVQELIDFAQSEAGRVTAAGCREFARATLAGVEASLTDYLSRAREPA